MKGWIITAWERVRDSYWFVPTLMVVLAVLLNLGTAAIDQTITVRNPENWKYIYTGGADGARAVFSTVAGSMITVAGMVFSLSVLTLALASQQFGSRLLGNFMRDTGNQVVLGTFVSSFVYCLLALRTVRSGTGQEFVPYLSVTVAIVLALASVGVMIYFIHHVAESINPVNIIAGVGEDLDRAIDELFPDSDDEDAPASRNPAGPPQGAKRFPVAAKASGYVQYFDREHIIAIAREHDWLVEACKRPGSLVIAGDTLADVAAATPPDAEQLDQLRGTFTLGSGPTSSQDLIFPINQIVQMAQRALSPGINDPHTAMHCIDRLGSSLSRMAARRLPAHSHADDKGVTRLRTRPHTFAEALGDAIDPIREYAVGSVAVTSRLIETLCSVARRISRPDYREPLLRQASILEQCVGANGGLTRQDRESLEAKLRELREILKA